MLAFDHKTFRRWTTVDRTTNANVDVDVDVASRIPLFGCKLPGRARAEAARPALVDHDSQTDSYVIANFLRGYK